MKELYWRIFILKLCFRWLPKINIGDFVFWKGQRFVAIQGCAHPTWEIQEIGKQERHSVDIGELTKEKSFLNYLGSFKSAYRFYMAYWFRIWVREGIKPWMKECNIWARP